MGCCRRSVRCVRTSASTAWNRVGRCWLMPAPVRSEIHSRTVVLGLGAPGGADAFAVQVDVGGHQGSGTFTRLVVRGQFGGAGAVPGGLVQSAGGDGL